MPQPATLCQLLGLLCHQYQNPLPPKKTSSQKLGRHASRRVRSGWNIFGKVSFGSKKFGQSLRKNWEDCRIMLNVGPNKVVFPFWLQQWQEICGIARFWLQQFKSYPDRFTTVFLRYTTVIPDWHRWVLETLACLKISSSTNTLFTIQHIIEWCLGTWI